MVAFRYADQERKNIAASEARARQQAALEASLAKRRAEELTGDISKTSIGLGNVDNTSDADKPVSTAQQTALNQKADASAVASALSAKLEWVAAPATASSTGTQGQVAYDSQYFYTCIATDTWVRAEHFTW